MTKYTIRIEVPVYLGSATEREVQKKCLDDARDAFPEASSICVESEDGTSETIFVRGK